MIGVLLNRQHYWKKQVFKDENTLSCYGLWSNYFPDWCNFYHFAPGGKTSFDKSADIW